MEYNFQPVEAQTWFDGLTVQKTYTSISKKLISRMGVKPADMTLLVDTENKAIAVKIGGEHHVRYSKNHAYCSALGRVMPKGRYKFVEKRGDLFICVHV